MGIKRCFWATIAVLFALPFEHYVNRSRLVCGNTWEAPATHSPLRPRSSELLVKLKRLRFGNDTVKIFPRQTHPPQVHALTQPGALWMAVNMRELALLPGDRLVVRDGDGNERIRADSSNASRLEPGSTVSMHMWDHPVLVLGQELTIEYYPALTTLLLPICRPQRDNAVAVLDSYFFAIEKSGQADSHQPNGELESVIGGSNDLKEAVCYKNRAPQMYNRAKPVVRLLIRKQESAQEEQASEFTTHSAWYFCTGWLVGKENHLLTNYHCIFKALGQQQQQQSLWGWKAVLMPPSSSNDQSLATADVNFMAETKSCKEPGVMGEKRGVVEATQAHVLAANQALDYCLLRLVPTQKSTDLSDKYGYLTLRASGPVDKEPIYIPQHPNGEPKEIASTKNGKPAIIRVPFQTIGRRDYLDSALATSGSKGVDPNVFYNADTMPGSSGSPVLSQVDNNVVALHHAGTVSPFSFVSPGTSDSGSSGADTPISEMNTGIRIDAIVQDLLHRQVLPPCALPVKCPKHCGKTKARSSANGPQCCSRSPK